MFDINTMGGEETSEIIVTLNMLLAYKKLYDFGIHLPFGEKRNIKYEEEDCAYSAENLATGFLNLLTNNEVEVSIADNDRGKIYGYELYVSEDEGTYYDYIINQPDIQEYFNYWKRKADWPEPNKIKNAYEYIHDSTFLYMVDNLIENSPNDYGCGYASFIANTFELIFLVSDDVYLKYDPDVMSKLIDLVEYCQSRNEAIKIEEEKEAEEKKQLEFKKKEEEIKCLRVS